MGAFFSLAGPKRMTIDYNKVSQNETCKRQRMSSSFSEEGARLIPSLPDELSIQIVARLPRISYFNVKLVSRKWMATVMSPELYKLRKELGTTEEWVYLLTKVEEDKLLSHALDPLTRKWQRLPMMPNVVYEDESRKGFPGRWMWNMAGPSINISELHVITKDANHRVAVLRADSCSSPSSSAPLFDGSLNEHSDLMTESDAVVWRVIATRDFGSAELRYAKAQKIIKHSDAFMPKVSLLEKPQ
ncbi:hypothetical protein FH972_015931 [Carpinus fangiana]|uniref:F-box domain-containing protein n=1 Tax=Carpinus fangiana TaxID=176857 RepID=A0A5N6RHL3_9ROSI|nr:hypothetical protein FH972_015931 [Carpinus fangiana]